jgi:hypothetical protein
MDKGGKERMGKGRGKREEKKRRGKKEIRKGKKEKYKSAIEIFYNLNPTGEAVLPNVFQNGFNSIRKSLQQRSQSLRACLIQARARLHALPSCNCCV